MPEVKDPELRKAFLRFVDAQSALAEAYATDEARAGRIRPGGSIRVTREPLTYERGGPHSFFHDIFTGYSHGDPEAQQRLTRHRQEMDVERRALNSSDGTGGEFIAPIWLMDEWIALA